MATTNDVTGDTIQSGNRKEDTDKYRTNWDRINWGNKGEKSEEVKKDERS